MQLPEQIGPNILNCATEALPHPQSIAIRIDGDSRLGCAKAGSGAVNVCGSPPASACHVMRRPNVATLPPHSDSVPAGIHGNLRRAAIGVYAQVVNALQSTQKQRLCCKHAPKCWWCSTPQTRCDGQSAYLV